MTLLSGIFYREVPNGYRPSLCHFHSSPFPTAKQDVYPSPGIKARWQLEVPLIIHPLSFLL